MTFCLTALVLISTSVTKMFLNQISYLAFKFCAAKKVMECKRKWEQERNITFDSLPYLNLDLHNLNDASVHEASLLPTERV